MQRTNAVDELLARIPTDDDRAELRDLVGIYHCRIVEESPAFDEPLLQLRTVDVAARRLADETIVLDLRSSLYLSTNAAGTVLWAELEQGTTRSRLVRALLEEFDVTGEQAARDVDAFLDDCRRRGLLAEHPPRDGVDPA